MTKVGFNKAKASFMHIDINSCFATIEQQARPHLRGKPVAVCSHDSFGACILAPSVEAKYFGIKTGMRVFEGKDRCADLVILTPDPPKYRYVHQRLKKIISSYSNAFWPKSIDEFVLDLGGYPAFDQGMQEVGREIKKRIKTEIGEWIKVSVGIAPSRFLAKTAAGLKKPDGLETIDHNNFWEVYKKLSLKDLCGINTKNAIRLKVVGINNCIEFYQSDIRTLRLAFDSITGYYWHLKLRGWDVADTTFQRKSFGNSYVLPKSTKRDSDVLPILSKLVSKMASRMREKQMAAYGVHLGIKFQDGEYWHKGRSQEKKLFDTRDIFCEIKRIFHQAPKKAVRKLAVRCLRLVPFSPPQLELFTDLEKKMRLNEAVDKINIKWGGFSITPARMTNTKRHVPDTIAFGK